jgi:hypothetical protein
VKKWLNGNFLAVVKLLANNGLKEMYAIDGSIKGLTG